MTGDTQWRDREVRGYEGDHVTRECLVREGPKDNNSEIHYNSINIVAALSAEIRITQSSIIQGIWCFLNGQSLTTLSANKGRFCKNSDIDTLISKRPSVENKAKLSQLEIVNKQYRRGGVLSFQL